MIYFCELEIFEICLHDKKIVLISPHPDDIEIFMFGILAVFKQRGDEIHLTIATDGSMGGNVSANNLIDIRKNETISALKYLGQPNFLGIHDGQLGFREKDTFKVKNNIFDINPDFIIGDLDSVDKSKLQTYCGNIIELPDQNFNDLEKILFFLLNLLELKSPKKRFFDNKFFPNEDCIEII